MNMHTTINNGAINQVEMAKCAYDLLMVAIGMIDETTVPAEVGAHVDLATHKLGRWLCDTPRTAQLGAITSMTIEPRPD